jgi:hypothetical protein
MSERGSLSGAMGESSLYHLLNVAFGYVGCFPNFDQHSFAESLVSRGFFVRGVYLVPFCARNRAEDTKPPEL